MIYIAEPNPSFVKCAQISTPRLCLKKIGYLNIFVYTILKAFHLFPIFFYFSKILPIIDQQSSFQAEKIKKY